MTDRDDKTKDAPVVGRRDVLRGAGAVGAMATAGFGANQARANVLQATDANGPFGEFRDQWFNNTHHSWFEFPSADPDVLHIYGYTDETSYAQGDVVDVHVSTSAATYDLTVYRDGAQRDVVFEQTGLPGVHHTTPDDAYLNGPRWPVSIEIQSSADWRSGGYVIELRAAGTDGQEIVQHGFFVLRPAKAGANKIAFVLATTTWQAYNDWGGSNFYEGVAGPDGNAFSPITSTRRPWARGFIFQPPGLPRIIDTAPRPIGSKPRYPTLDYAYAHGYCKYFAGAGWASFDSHFARWADVEGYGLDYFAQDDLHRNPDLLNPYKTVVMVGHDEYHTLEEREALDSFVEAGGNLARFGANVIWQARREDGQLICYKARAIDEDPVRNDPARKHTLTTAWEAMDLNLPPALTWGVNGLRGVYMKMGGFQPRATGGYTVYRPKHWALEGTDLYYGDVFGQDAAIAGYEGDGLAYTFRYGQPYPTGEDGASKDIEIIAMALAGMDEEDHGNPETYLYARDGDLSFSAKAILGADTEENRAKLRYGSGMMVNMSKGQGEVFNAATTDWISGLRDRDPFVEIITRNVLNKFTA